MKRADPGPIRYVVTHIARDGTRVMTQAAQGRNTHETEAEAQEWLEVLFAHNSDVRVRSIYGAQAVNTFAVRPVECWPGHFDPKQTVFES